MRNLLELLRTNGEQVVENRKKKVAVMYKGLKIIVSDLNKNYLVKIEENGNQIFKAWLNPENATNKVNDLFGAIMEQIKYLNCFVNRQVGNKTFYTGEIKVNGVELMVNFNQIEEKRYFVNGYHVAKNKQTGDNVIAFLNEKGVQITRKELFDNIKATL